METSRYRTFLHSLIHYFYPVPFSHWLIPSLPRTFPSLENETENITNLFTTENPRPPNLPPERIRHPTEPLRQRDRRRQARRKRRPPLAPPVRPISRSPSLDCHTQTDSEFLLLLLVDSNSPKKPSAGISKTPKKSSPPRSLPPMMGRLSSITTFLSRGCLRLR